MKIKNVCSELPYRGFQLFIITGIFFTLFAFEAWCQATAPAQPAIPTVTAASATSLTISWTAPNDGGSPITSYIVYWKLADADEFTDQKEVDAPSTSTTITGLQPGTRYHVALAAKNAIARGTVSSNREGTTNAATAPAQPAMPTVTAAGSTSLTVSWTAPNDGDSPITSYVIFWRDRLLPDTDANWKDKEFSGTGTSTSITGLEPGRDYNVAVAAKNAIGQSPVSVHGVGTTNAAAPDAPAALTVTALSTTSLEVDWTAPNDNGAGITGYDVQYREGSSGGFTNWSHTGIGTTATITSLQPGTTYEVQVRATNSVGDSSWSTGTGTTSAAAPDAPTALMVTALSPTSLQVSWTAPNANGAAIDGYDVEYREGSSGSFTNWPHTGISTTATITGLDSGTLYQVQVRATNSAGDSGWSTGTGTTNSPDPTAPFTPNAPTVSGIENSTTSLQITWAQPNTGGSPITDYDVEYREYREQNPENYEPWTHDTTALTTEITGLQPATTYEARVLATNAIGSSGWSLPGSGTTGTPPQVTPPPQENNALPIPNVQPSENNSQTTLVINWASYTGDGTPTGYEIQYKQKNPGLVINHPHEGTQTTTLLSNLLPGTTYQIRVRAKMADGTGPWSPWGEGTTSIQRGVIHQCPIGWIRGSAFGNTKKALIYELKIQADTTNATSIYQLKSLAIYVHPDENLETLDGWTLKVGTLYNNFGKTFKLTAENSVIDAHDFAHIKNPEETPIPMGSLGYIGQSLPSFDYRLYDAEGMRVDFGISCYKEGGLMFRLWNTKDPRVLRVLPLEVSEEALFVQMRALNWQSLFFRSEWTAAIMPDLPVAAAPSQVKKPVVGTWAELKRQILQDD